MDQKVWGVLKSSFGHHSFPLKQVFQEALGWQHPRTQAACRNLRHMQHMCTQLEMKYNIRDRPKPLGREGVGGAQGGNTAGGAASGGRRKTGGSGSKAGRRPGSPSRRTAGGGGGAGGAGGNGGEMGGAPSQGPQPLTLQQRLAAFRSRREGSGAPHGAKKSAGSAAASRSPADLMYLGGGLHLADGDTLDLYERIKGDIADHASGSLIRNLPDDGK